jgi:hypothetical protein
VGGEEGIDGGGQLDRDLAVVAGAALKLGVVLEKRGGSREGGGGGKGSAKGDEKESGGGRRSCGTVRERG